MKYLWQDLPKPMNCFTVRSAVMWNLDNKKPIQYYSANTKIVVVQKCVTPTCTYYRTQEATNHHLDYVFEASAFGLPNESAPLAPSATNNSFIKRSRKSATTAPKPAKKQTIAQKKVSPKGGEEKRKSGWFKKLFGRRNG